VSRPKRVTTQIYVSVEPYYVELVDAAARRLGLTRSGLVRKLIIERLAPQADASPLPHRGTTTKHSQPVRASQPQPMTKGDLRRQLAEAVANTPGARRVAP